MRRRSCLPLLVASGLLLMGAADCGTLYRSWIYEGGSRDSWQHPEEVVATLRLTAGDVVADLGAGSGYFTARLARAVAPGGRVLASDIDVEMNSYLFERMIEEKVDNVEIIQAEPFDPKLPAGTVDLIFTANTYHHLPRRVAYFARVARTLAQGGRVAIVDFSPTAGWLARRTGHFTPPELIVAEMNRAGYRLSERHQFLPRQSFLVFTLAVPNRGRPAGQFPR